MVRQVEQVEVKTESAWQADAAATQPSMFAIYLRHTGYVIAVCVLSTVLVFAIELVSRGSISETMLFFQELYRPAWTTVGFYALVMIAFDALLGRSHNGLLVVAPCVLLFTWIGRQKALYLGDPLYPTDFLYSRQVVDLLPLLVRERPWSAAGIVVITILVSAGLVLTWRFWRQRTFRLNGRGRLWRLVVAIPALVFFVSIMDYNNFSWARDRLRVQPIMWDQKENYAHNGFTMAFALNLPMADLTVPQGYSSDAITAISMPAIAMESQDKPDIIMVMSESFWDPTRLRGVNFNRDPLPTVRARQSGSVFSPEFGGMTANVEFEALTGFSNAFLPYGSIPYQQYIRHPLPSLPTFLKSKGYVTKAIHPYHEWFWNRRNVYQAFGFDAFRSEENLPKLASRGPLVSDAALMEEVIREADETKGPFFFFTVTLQGHGPYEPYRYKDPSIDVATETGVAEREAIRTYSEGVADADRGLKRLMDWASKRKRQTILVFFGDHLPPLGDAYISTGYMKGRVADRRAPLDEMLKQHETPLVVWSNRTGTNHGIGTVSPAFLPLHVLELAGLSHPYYTGFLGAIRDRYKVIDRHLLLSTDDMSNPDWIEKPGTDPLINNFRLLQYDMMFGNRAGQDKFFPELNVHGS
ncbi:LTA synthase family protein [Candidatus Phyllobacterium onerii]|uniref:LTA synthase family protein n=1 Tax=Candidatus Phyllobacterium onerii TaxID=3020828 RepID=UPI00232EA3F4|nr:LTA synthase family protein [Phyllobacterium sp. IY22]